MVFLHTIFEARKSEKGISVTLFLDGPVGSNGGAAVDDVEEQVLLQYHRTGQVVLIPDFSPTSFEQVQVVLVQVSGNVGEPVLLEEVS